MNLRLFLLALMVLILILPGKARSEEALRVGLGDALALCLEKSWEVESARQRVLEAEGGVVTARAGFMPTLKAEGSYTRLSEIPALETVIPVYGIVQYPVFGPLGDTIGYTYVPGVIGQDEMEFEMGDEDNYLARIGVTQPLFMWGRTVNGYRIANHNLAAARLDLKKSQQDAVFNVTRSFYSVLVAREFLALTEESYQQVDNHATSAARLYEEGKISRLDLMRANVARENMKPQLLRARNVLATATDGLKLAMGLDVGVDVEVSGRLEFEPIGFEMEEKISQGRMERPDLHALDQRSELAERALALAQAGNKPSLIAMFNYEYKRPYNFEDDWGRDWNATLALSIPLFDGFATSGESKRAHARLQQMRTAREGFAAAVELEVKAAYLALKEAEESILSQQKNVEEAEEAHRIAERQYENGLLSNLEYLDTQIALSQAKANYIKALGDFNTARAELDRAVGTEAWKGELGR